MTQPTISVEDLGPVINFDYTPNEYGLHVLRGRQGAGKTTILRAVQLAVDGRTDVKPTPRDGQRRGSAIVAGHRIRISESVRHDGELSVEGVGDLSIADLHTPKFKTPDVRDRHRISTLARLAGVTADASLFHRLLGRERFEGIVPADSLKTDDLVEMAGRVKRALEAEALRLEKRRDTEFSDARAQATIAEGADLTAESDEAKLQANLSDAMKAASRIEAERNAYLAKVGEATLARQRLDKLPTVDREAAIAAHDAIDAKCKAAFDSITELETKQVELQRQLAELELTRQGLLAAYESALAARQSAAQAVEATESAAATRAEAERIIAEAEGATGPSADDLTRAQSDRASAEAAVTRGFSVRAAKKAAEKSEAHMQEGNRLNRVAGELRDAAKDTRGVLADAVAKLEGCPLTVVLDDEGNPRLCVESDRSETEYFEDLSDGERWPIILGIASARNRMIVLPQAAYGELSPETRRQLDQLAKQHECYILTAIADDCDLVAESFE